MGATTVGRPANVTTGIGVTTLPVSSPITVISDGAHEDSFWRLTNGKLIPDTTTLKVGLGSVPDYVIPSSELESPRKVLIHNTSTNEIESSSGEYFSILGHGHQWNQISDTPITLANYGITDQLQPLDADLTAIAELSYSQLSFLKKTGASTWGFDTTTYSPVSHTHNYEPRLDQCPVEGYVLSGSPNGDRTWIAPPVGSAVPGVASHDELAGLADDDHSQYALLAGRNSDVYHVDDIHEYTAAHGVMIDGVLIKDGDIIAYA
jgi:hypothetical protein